MREIKTNKEKGTQRQRQEAAEYCVHEMKIILAKTN
jgi:hypothetical protein